MALAAANAAAIASTGIAETKQRVASLISIAGVHARLGDVEAVKDFMRAAMAASDASDTRPQSALPSLISLAQLESGQPHPPLEAAVTIESPWERVHALVQIANSLSE